jgi:hypothetical protein
MVPCCLPLDTLLSGSVCLWVQGVGTSDLLTTDGQLLSDKVHAIVGEFDNEVNK